MKRPNYYLGLLLFLMWPSIHVPAQTARGEAENNESWRVVFYNLENYFDTRPDSLLNYNDFTPEGKMHWTEKRYAQKQARIFQVLTAIAEWRTIALMGFAEIENEFVLEDLVRNTPLGRDDYRIVHFDSDDPRGIDVGLIYDATHFTLISARKLKVADADDSTFSTRDILYVKGLLGGDTLHVFVNHWVSRWRGLLASAYLRMLCAETLRQVTDSICALNPDAAVLVMGDFNDGPEDESILKLTSDGNTCHLWNLALKPLNDVVGGSLKHGSIWYGFDRFLLSRKMLTGKDGLALKGREGFVFDAAFLLEKDEKYLGFKPKRTYQGFKYNGGVSDHLPVFIDIFVAGSK